MYCGVHGASKTEIQKYEFSGGSWSKTADVTSGSSDHNWRPVVPRNAHSELPVCWMYGPYNTYTNYNTVIASAKAPKGIEIGSRWISGSAAFMSHVTVENGCVELKDVTEPDGAKSYLNSTGLRSTEGWNPNNHIIEYRISGGVDIGATTHQGLIGWYKDDNNSHFFYFTPSSGRGYDLALRKREGGSDTDLDSCCNDLYSQGSWYNFKIQKSSAATLKLYEGSQEKLSGSVTNWDEKLQIGLQTWNEKTWRWDRIFVRKYTSPEPLIIKQRTSGKADVIKAIVAGIMA